MINDIEDDEDDDDGEDSLSMRGISHGGRHCYSNIIHCYLDLWLKTVLWSYNYEHIAFYTICFRNMMLWIEFQNCYHIDT